jgi:SAM-dependent methyltransferase
MEPALEEWHFECQACLYESADLAPSINVEASHDSLDEAKRESGLKALRQDNFRVLLDKIRPEVAADRRLLDVGCAHGWFLELASQDFTAMGIEPDDLVYRSTLQRGLPVRQGYFPTALESGETFDVITFNDVFEHIPDVASVLQSCRAHLSDNGLLVLNLPNTSGAFYLLSKVFRRFGIPGPFDRLWQKGLPSPHLHYFNRKNLAALLERHGFNKVSEGSLPTIRLRGLYDRIACAGNMSAVKAGALWLSVALALPVLKLFPSDIIYIVSRKND